VNNTKQEAHPSFVCELSLATTPAQARALSVRLDAARQIYNASLGEALRVLTVMRDSKDWQHARTMAKGKERTACLRKIITDHDFKQSALDRFAIACKNACWIGEHLGSHEAQAIAKRAFAAVRQYALGKRGRPRFKGKRGLHSVEGKTNAAGIRWRDGRVQWSELSIPAMLDPIDRHGWQAQALAHKTKYCRIVRRALRGRDRYALQLVQQGAAPWKPKNSIGHDTVGLDLGPSTVAVVTDAHAVLERFCPTVTQPWAMIRRLQRAMDRSRRATNPTNYTSQGTVKTGAKTWLKSARYRTLRVALAEAERRLVSERKRAHGELANRIIALGHHIKTEDLSYKWFQSTFGRSVKVRAPGMFLDLLRRKAGSAGGQLVEFPTRTTRLSQTCHGCGAIVKKSLSQRSHTCPCGVGPVQRDLYSAFLARHILNDQLDARQTTLAWPGAEPLLRRAASSCSQSANGSGICPAHATTGVRVDRPSKRTGSAAKALDAVRSARVPESQRDVA
jgi:putative transposase